MTKFHIIDGGREYLERQIVRELFAPRHLGSGCWELELVERLD